MEEINKEIHKKKFTKVYVITSIISLLVGFAIFSLFVFILKRPVVDGFAYSGLILVGAGGLIWIGYEGFFDVFGYGIKQTGSMLFSKKANENNDFSSYKEQKTQIRSTSSKFYISVILVGLIYLLGIIITKLVA